MSTRMPGELVNKQLICKCLIFTIPIKFYDFHIASLSIFGNDLIQSRDSKANGLCA